MDKNQEVTVLKQIKNASDYGELVAIFKKVEQTPTIIEAALKKNGLVLEFITAQTPEICLTAVLEDGAALEFVKEQTPELCMEAVKQDGMALKFVKDQTFEICQAAYYQNELSLHLIRDNELKMKVKDAGNKEVQQTQSFSDLRQSFEKEQNLGFDDYENYMEAQREAEEAYLASLDAEMDKLDAATQYKPDFSELENAEREVNEIAYQLHLAKEKEREEAQKRNTAYSFSDLEEAQRNVDNIFVHMFMCEDSVGLGERVSQIIKDGELLNDEQTDVMERLLKKYIAFSKEQGVPDEIIAFMSEPGISLSQAMQIKFGYEDGLSIDEIAQYAKPEIQRNDMVLARYNLLCLKELSFCQAVSRMKEPGKKPSLDQLVAGAALRTQNQCQNQEKEVVKEAQR